MASVTIEEIAEVAGVSASTVSRVINNKSIVNEKTRKRVLIAVKKLHYSPNETARNLVNKSTNLVGILLPDIRRTHHTGEIYYIQQELDKMGYCSIIISTGHEDEDKAHFIQILSQRRVEATVLIGSTFQCEAVCNAIKEYMSSTPVFIVNGYLELPNVYGIIEDEQNGVSSCVKYLSQKKRKNIAFVLDYRSPSNLQKLIGFKNGIEEHYAKNEVKTLIYEIGTDSIQSFYEAIYNFYKKNPMIDAIICTEDRIAVAAIRALHKLRVTIPEKVSIIGMNNSELTEICTPTLTSLDSMWMDVSCTVARNLIGALKGNHIIKKVMVFSHLVEREST